MRLAGGVVRAVRAGAGAQRPASVARRSASAWRCCSSATGGGHSAHRGGARAPRQPAAAAAGGRYGRVAHVGLGRLHRRRCRCSGALLQMLGIARLPWLVLLLWGVLAGRRRWRLPLERRPAAARQGAGRRAGGVAPARGGLVLRRRLLHRAGAHRACMRSFRSTSPRSATARASRPSACCGRSAWWSRSAVFWTQGRWFERLSMHAGCSLAAGVSALRFAAIAAFGALDGGAGADADDARASPSRPSTRPASRWCRAIFPGRLRGRGQALYTMLGYGLSGVVGGVGRRRADRALGLSGGVLGRQRRGTAVGAVPAALAPPCAPPRGAVLRSRPAQLVGPDRGSSHRACVCRIAVAPQRSRPRLAVRAVNELKHTTMTRATRKRWAVGAAVVVVVAIAAAVAVQRRSARPRRRTTSRRSRWSSRRARWCSRWAAMPVTHRVLRPAGGAADSAIVRAKAAGTLLGLTVAEGSRVKAGQALGRIDLAELQSRVSERQASARSRRAPQLAQAERTHASNERPGGAERSSRRPRCETSRAQLDSGARAARGGAGAARHHRASACARRRWWRRSPASSPSATWCRARR